MADMGKESVQLRNTLRASSAAAFEQKQKFTHVDRQIYARGYEALKEDIRNTKLPRITTVNTLKLTKRLLDYRLFIPNAKERLQYITAVFAFMGIYIKISDDPSMALQVNDAFFILASLYAAEAKIPNDPVKAATLEQLVAFTKSMNGLGAWNSRKDVKEFFRKLYDRMNMLGNRANVDPFDQAGIKSKIEPTWSAMADINLIGASIEFLRQLKESLGLGAGEKTTIKQFQEAKGTPYYEIWARGLIPALEDAGVLMRLKRDIANMTKQDFREEVPSAIKESSIIYIQELTALKGANYVGKLVMVGLDPLKDFGLIDKNAKPKIAAETRTAILPFSPQQRTAVLPSSANISISNQVPAQSLQEPEATAQARKYMNWKGMPDNEVIETTIHIMRLHNLATLNQLRTSGLVIAIPDR